MLAAIVLFEVVYSALVLVFPSFINIFISNNSNKNSSEWVDNFLFLFQYAIITYKANDLSNATFEIFGYGILWENVSLLSNLFVLHLWIFVIILRGVILHESTVLTN